MGKPTYLVRLAHDCAPGDEVRVEVKASNRREAEVLARDRHPGYRRIGRVTRGQESAGRPRAKPQPTQP